MAEGENDILFTPVGREELVVVTPKGHPISYESAVDLKAGSRNIRKSSILRTAAFDRL